MSTGDKSYLAEISSVGTYSGLDARLRQIEFEWDTAGVKASGTFSYLAFRDGKITQDDFADFIYQRIIPFCLPRDYIKSCQKKLHETGDERWFHEPVDSAKELFIKAKKKNKKSGEPGEVVLFTLLEGILNAPRLVSKMKLKTSSNMEVYGSDAIHMSFDPEEQSLIIYWGEAKLYGELSSALTEIASSIKDFRDYDSKKNGIQRDFDIQVIQSHPDIFTSDIPATKEALLSYFDPYSENSNQLKEIHACLAIWDWSFCKKLSTLPPEEAEEKFKAKYLERIKSACDLFLEKIHEQSLESYRFHFFLIPLESVTDFRRRFCKKVGLPFEENIGEKQ